MLGMVAKIGLETKPTNVDDRLVGMVHKIVKVAVRVVIRITFMLFYHILEHKHLIH